MDKKWIIIGSIGVAALIIGYWAVAKAQNRERIPIASEDPQTKKQVVPSGAYDWLVRHSPVVR